MDGEKVLRSWTFRSVYQIHKKVQNMLNRLALSLAKWKSIFNALSASSGKLVSVEQFAFGWFKVVCARECLDLVTNLWSHHSLECVGDKFRDLCAPHAREWTIDKRAENFGGGNLWRCNKSSESGSMRSRRSSIFHWIVAIYAECNWVKKICAKVMGH